MNTTVKQTHLILKHKKGSELFNFTTMERAPCLLSFAKKKKNECSGFPLKTNLKGITKSSLGTFSVVLCVMHLLYCLGSCCHLTAFWSRQKSTIFVFPDIFPHCVSVGVWKCDQCGVPISSLFGNSSSNWAFGLTMSPCIIVSPGLTLLLLGEHDGQLKDGVRGGEQWGHAGGRVHRARLGH